MPKHKSALLDRLLNSKGKERRKLAEQIFHQVVHQLATGDIEVEIMPIPEFLEQMGATHGGRLHPFAEAGGATCAVIEPLDTEGEYKIYMLLACRPMRLARALLHEVLHIVFDEDGMKHASSDSLAQIIATDKHKKIYRAEAAIWHILKPKSKRWLRQFVLKP